jgi:hypothetical protein
MSDDPNQNEEILEIEDKAIEVYVPRGVLVPAASRRQVILALRTLPPRKRIFLNFLAEHFWHVSNAYKAMVAEKGDSYLHRRTVSKWMRDPKFFEVMRLLRSLDTRRVEAVDPDRILMDHRHIADYNMEEVVTFNEKTGKTSRRMRNGATALAALDKLGKHKKLWGTEEQTARVVLDVVDLTGRARIIDVTPSQGEDDGGNDQTS